MDALIKRSLRYGTYLMLATLALALYVLLPSGEKKQAQSDNNLLYFAGTATADTTPVDGDSPNCDGCGCDGCDGS